MNILDTMLEKLSAGDRPNHFTRAMGELIRKAREEMGFNQRELAEKIYRRQAALSDMENGKMEPNAGTLTLLSYHLQKPISYFFPDLYTPEKNLGELSDLEKEILMCAKALEECDQIRILAQLRALINLDKEY